MFSGRAVKEQLNTIEELVKHPRGAAGTIADFMEIEAKLGMDGIMDFCSAPPETFAVPPAVRGTITYTDEYRDRIVNNIPALRRSIEKFLSTETDKTAYVVVSTIWPDSLMNFREMDYVSVTMNRVILPPSIDHPAASNSDPLKFVCCLWNDIRGSFEYGRGGVVVCAVDISELDIYFEREQFSRVKNYDHIPARFVLDVFGAPTQEERELLDGVIRAYWYRLVAMGHAPVGNVFADKIPDELVAGSSSFRGSISLRNAKEILEAWHRLAKINRVIAEHKKSVSRV